MKKSLSLIATVLLLACAAAVATGAWWHLFGILICVAALSGDGDIVLPEEGGEYGTDR